MPAETKTRMKTKTKTHQPSDSIIPRAAAEADAVAVKPSRDVLKKINAAAKTREGKKMILTSFQRKFKNEMNAAAVLSRARHRLKKPDDRLG